MRHGCSTRLGRCSTGWRAGREDELLARWREEAARNGRAATGWEETLQAASDGRVELPARAGWRRSGRRTSARVRARAQAEDGSCPLDGTTMQAADTGLDLAVHQTLTHGGTVEVIGEDHRDLEPVGGVAALLEVLGGVERARGARRPRARLLVAAWSSFVSKRSSRFSASAYLPCACERCVPTRSKSSLNLPKSCCSAAQ